MLTLTHLCVIILCNTKVCLFVLFKLKEALPPSEENKGRKENLMDKIFTEIELSAEDILALVYATSYYLITFPGSPDIDILERLRDGFKLELKILNERYPSYFNRD